MKVIALALSLVTLALLSPSAFAANPSCASPSADTWCSGCQAQTADCSKAQAELMTGAMPPTSAKKVVAAKLVDLEKAPTIDVSLKRGMCLGAYFWLQPEASLTKGVKMRLEAQLARVSAGQSVGQWKQNRQLFVLEPYCPESAGKVKIFFENGAWNKAGTHLKALTEAGTGKMQYAVWTTQTSQQSLDDHAAATGANACRQCTLERRDCQTSSPQPEFKTCAAQFAFCLKVNELTKATCQP